MKSVVAALAGITLLAQQVPPQQPPIFRSGANLVRVDVTVLDHQGLPVTSLAADDFEVEEDGVPQAVQTFKFVSADGQPPAGDDTSLAIRSPEHAAAEAARDEVRVFLIFWDEYHIGRFASAIQARKALDTFVGSAFSPTDLVALMDPLLPTDAIRFTRDHRGLVPVIHKLEGRFGVYVPTRSAIEEAQLGSREIVRLRSEVTISALKAAASYLGSLREGRKAIIFVSEGLPGLGLDAYSLLQDLIQSANNNNTAIYTVDPRGLMGGASDFLRMIAENTGAEAIVNSNTPERAMRHAITDASAFYLIGYAPVKNESDGKFHQIKVRVKPRGLDVRARKGYWAPRAADVERAKRAAAIEAPVEVTTALGTLSASRPERTVDVWAGISRGADGGAELTVAWTPRGRQLGPLSGSVSVVAQSSGAKQPGEAPLSALRLDIKTGTGVVQLQTTIRDAQGQTIDEDTRVITVPDFADLPLALGTPVVHRARNPSELRALTAGSEPPPFASREFSRSDRLFIRLAVYGSGAAEATVSAHLLGRGGAALLPLPVTKASGSYHIDLPLSSVARGDYLIEIAAVAGDDRATTLVPLRIL
jgi:VWFA-related protein